jgi:hypothetical protein
MKAEAIDNLVDEGEVDVMELADLKSAHRLKQNRVNVDFPPNGWSTP